MNVHGGEDGPSGRPEGKLIGEAAAELGVDAHVLRHWEDVGVLSPSRDASGRRRYASQQLRLARGVRAAQSAGLSLAQIRGFLQADAAGRAALLSTHGAGLRAELARLHRSVETVERALGAPVDPTCPYGL